MDVRFDSIYKHAQIKWEVDEQGYVHLYFPQKHWIQRMMRRVFKRIPEYQVLRCDERTSRIWKLIDGERSIEAIYNAFLTGETEFAADIKVRFGTVIHHFIAQEWIERKEDNL